MRIIIATALFAALVAPAAADRPDKTARISACYNISSHDGRAACLARAHGDRGRCHSIQSNDRRQECLAEVGRR